MQRRALAILAAEPKRIFPTVLLAAMATTEGQALAKFQGFDADIQFLTIAMHPVKTSQRNSVSRALNKLWRDGKVVAYDRKGATWWRIKPGAERAPTEAEAL